MILNPISPQRASMLSQAPAMSSAMGSSNCMFSVSAFSIVDCAFLWYLAIRFSWFVVYSLPTANPVDSHQENHSFQLFSGQPRPKTENSVADDLKSKQKYCTVLRV